MRRIFFIVVFIVSWFFVALSQPVANKNVDSLVGQILSHAEEQLEEGNTDSVQKIVLKVSPYIKRVNHKDLLAKYLYLKAYLAYQESQYSKSLEFLDSALSIVKSPDLRNLILLRQADLYNTIGLYKNAYSIYQKLIKVFLSHKKYKLVSDIYNSLGNLFYNLRMVDSALYYSKLAIELDKKHNFHDYLITDYANLVATLLADSVFHDTALVYLQKALKLVKKFNDPYYFATIYANYGDYYAYQRDYQKAQYYYLLAAKNFKLAYDYEDLIYAYLSLTELEINFNHLSDAKKYFDSARYYVKIVRNLSADLNDYYLSLGAKLYSKLKNYVLAYQFLSKYQHFRDSINYYQQQQLLSVYKLKQQIAEHQYNVATQRHKYQRLLIKSRFYKAFAIFITLVLIIVVVFIVLLVNAYHRLKASAERDAIYAILYRLRTTVAFADPHSTSISDLFQRIFDIVLGSKNLNLLPHGMVYLVNNQGELILTAYKNIGELKDKCRVVKPEQCIIGKPLKDKKPLIIRNDPNNMCFYAENLHFIAPLIVNDQVIGIIVFYLRPKHYDRKRRKLLELLYLEISFIIERYMQQKKLLENAKIQKELNQKLFAQTLKLEESKRQLQEAYKKLDEQSKLLKETLQNLQESIVFASYLVKTYLPSENYLNKILGKGNYFLIYKPKDIIGGDFYFFEKIENKLILLVGDATGHGVPGALLATQTITFIHRLIYEEKKLNPAQILTDLRIRIKKLFSQTDLHGIKNVSVDMALCVIDLKTKILDYSGAFIPAMIVRDNEVINLKPTRNPVGNYIREVDFKQITMQLQTNDIIYLFTDGLQDQLNINLQKFQRKNLKRLLLEISRLDMPQQKEILESILLQWQGDQEQTDDITVFGYIFRF